MRLPCSLPESQEVTEPAIHHLCPPGHVPILYVVETGKFSQSSIVVPSEANLSSGLMTGDVPSSSNHTNVYLVEVKVVNVVESAMPRDVVESDVMHETKDEILCSVLDLFFCLWHGCQV
jgi:hypothetical protein